MAYIERKRSSAKELQQEVWVFRKRRELLRSTSFQLFQDKRGGGWGQSDLSLSLCARRRITRERVWVTQLVNRAFL
jgi:hypothetical protein